MLFRSLELCLYLPQQKAGTVRERTSFMTTVEPSTRPFKILVAEDNLMNQRTTELLLKKLGHTSFCVDDGQQAVEAWQQDSGYDLILMDIHMPVLGGIEALEMIRSTESETGSAPVPIIALTADVLKGTEEKLLNLGFDAYLTKPLRVNDLADLLRSIPIRVTMS